jgi:hypothetical protein
MSRSTGRDELTDAAADAAIEQACRILRTAGSGSQSRAAPRASSDRLSCACQCLELGRVPISAVERAGADQGGQRVAHPLGIRDPRVEIEAALLGEPAGCVAAVRGTCIQLQQLVDLVKGEPELLGTPDEQQQADAGGRVVAVATPGARWFREQAAALVVAQGLAVHAGSIRQPFGPHDPMVNPVLNYGVNL